MRDFAAHIRDDGKTQNVQQHLQNVAEYASENMSYMKLSETAYFIGLLHDMGKFTEAFDTYIKKSANGEKQCRGSVNHTFCGVIYILENFWKADGDEIEKLTAELTAYTVGAHHGIFDIGNFENGFEHRLNASKSDIHYNEAVGNFFEFFSIDDINEQFQKACSEIRNIYKKIAEKYPKKNFMLGLLARVLLSALVDGDWRDTSEFMNDSVSERKTADWKSELEFFEDNLQAFSSKSADTAVNRVRGEFSDKCKDFAVNHENGIYRLSLPTGGGKTFSSLRLALTNAEKFGKKHIFFVIPLLSIIEQNAIEIRNNIKDKTILTEHHSNVMRERGVSEKEQEFDKFESLTESWDYPVIITTLVQLLNTLFSGGLSAIRRMRSLCNSVLVIDEVQSMPVKSMKMFCSAMNFLADFCNVTVILSSATQPEFQNLDTPMKIRGDVVEYEERLFEVFKRTEIIDKTTPYCWDMDNLAEFADEVSENADSLLIICNTKASSLNLYKKLLAENRNIFYLSAGMCTKHRIDTVEKIKGCLDRDEKLICVSTQVVEAGVDFSFKAVIRVIAGIDNIVQAAGRCNRHGESAELGKVYIVNLKPDCENLSMLKEIQIAGQCTDSILTMIRGENGDISSAENIARYYKRYYNEGAIKNQFPYPVPKEDFKLYCILSSNAYFTNGATVNKKYRMKQAFKTAGKHYEVFDTKVTDVLVEYEESANIIAGLCSEKAKYDISYLKSLIEQAKPYMIRLYKYQIDILSKNGMLYNDINERILILNKDCYSAKTGFDLNNTEAELNCF